MRLAHLGFEPPGPGVWSTDGLHGFKPRTLISALSNVTVTTGMQISGWTYGSMVAGMGFASIHRFGYGQMRFLLERQPGPDDTARARFEAEIRANPDIQGRLQRAEEAIATKRWRADVEHWDSVTKPWLLNRTLEITDLDPSSMNDEGLTDHLWETILQHRQASMHHHLLNMVNGTPRGLFMVNAMEWTGMTPDEIEPLFIGSSPISAGDEPELRNLVAAIEKNPSAAALLKPDDSAAENLQSLLHFNGEVGSTARAFVRMVGYRTLLGWEPMAIYTLEKPDLILSKIEHGLQGTYPRLDAERLARIRDKVPQGNRQAFDELFDDARKYHRIRDERDLYCNMPTGGLIRRAVIEIGHRLTAKGILSNAEHATEASPDELRSLLVDGSGPADTELGDRYAYRQEYSIEDVPPQIGTPDQIPVPFEWLPDIARLFARMQMVNMFEGPNEAPEGKTLKGKAASPGVYEGRARVISGADQFDQIEPGDILVTSATNPAFNVVLPRVGGIVTQYGGLLSHAAIVAREFGLPSIVGCKGLLSEVEDGDILRIDGDAGTVTIT
jgi:pyruvate,water dikinase